MFDWLNFGQPWFLIGGAAAAIPIVLHLLHRVRAPELLFSTLRFLRISMEKTARRRKLHNWLLLAMRALLFGLLAAAVAQPVFKSSDLRFGEEDLAAVIVVDNSLSMGARDEKTTRFDRARLAVEQLLNDNPRPKKQALLFTNGPDALDAPEWQVNRRETVKRLGEGQVGIGRASLGPVLSQAARLLADEKLPNRAIYVVTDMQDLTLRELAGVEALRDLQEVPLMIINTSNRKPDNVAITELRIGREGRVIGSPLRIEAQIANTGATPEEVGVGIAVDGEILATLSQTIHLPEAGEPGCDTWVNFDCTLTKPGWHGGQVFLMKPKPNVRTMSLTNLRALRRSGDAWSDSLSADDRRFFAVYAVEQIRAVVVRPDGQKTGPRASDYYVRAALSVRAASIRARYLELSSLDEPAINDTDVIICTDVPAPSPAIGRAMREFVRRGGTLVIFLGPNYLPDDYNQVFGPVLPGRLTEALGRGDQRGQARRLERVEIDHPLFTRLHDDMTAYQLVLVWRYAKMNLDAGSGPEVLARLDNDDPLLVARRIGAGTAYTFTTTATPLWSNLPTSMMFLPVLVRMSLQSVSAGPRAETIAENDVVSLALEAKTSQTVEVAVPGRGAGAEPVRVTSKIDTGDNMAVFRDTYRAGIYQWQTVGESPQRGAFVVNPDGNESNLAEIDAGRLLAESPIPNRTFVAANSEELARIVEEQRRGSPLWDYVLFVVVLFAVLECLLANRSRPASQPAPAAAPGQETPA